MLDDSFRVVIFVGASQKNVPIEMVTSAQKLGSRVEWTKVGAEGRNALDFFIACRLGRVLEKQPPRPECIVLSKDKGFDPLLRHLNGVGLKCRRIDSLHELGKQAVARLDPDVQRAIEVLGKSEKRSRPRKRKTLAQAISAMFQKKLSRQDIDRIIDTLFSKQLIHEAHGLITYNF